MKSVALPYGKGVMTVEVEDSRLKAVLRPSHESAKAGDEREIVRKALLRPVASPRLCELAKGKKHILLITSDHTRPLPSRITLPLYLEELYAGNPTARVTILVATGMHRPTTEAELRAKLGDEVVDRERVVVHQAAREEDMAFFGTLPSGGELWLNKLVKEADLVIAEGFIEPHFFAGFSGGRKSVLPGVASRKTVLYNHNAGFIKDPRAVQGNLLDNPIHRDMLYAAKQAKLAFVLNVVIDADKRIVAAFAGDSEKAHEEGCALCRRMAEIPRVEGDVVITSNGGYPLDQNVYQAVKGMTAAESCVRPGGVVIVCAALGDGHGGESFYQWFAGHSGAEEVARLIENTRPEDTAMDQWEAQIMARVMNRATVVMVTGEENRGLVEAMRLRWAASANEALALARELVGQHASVVVIPDGVGVIVTG